jgi:DnaJ-class molecular chaperone
MCPYCRGSGAESEDDYAKCSKCKGSGHIIEKR